MRICSHSKTMGLHAGFGKVYFRQNLSSLGFVVELIPPCCGEMLNAASMSGKKRCFNDSSQYVCKKAQMGDHDSYT